MTRSRSARIQGKGSSVVRLYGRAHAGWRKIATCGAAVLAIALGYHVIFGRNGLTVYQQKRQDAEALQMQLRSLHRENELLKGHVERLQNDPNAIEHQAREELHYTRPGEVIYTMPAALPAKGATNQGSSKH